MILLNLINANNINAKNLKHLFSKTNTKNIKDMLLYLRNIDIKEFIEIDECIDWIPTKKQYEIMENIIKYNRSIVLLGKGSGKTSMNAIIMRFMVLKELLKDELDMNRIDFCNMCSTAKSARNSFFRELTIQLRKSKIFNFVKKMYNIRKQDVSFLNEQIMIHSLNSETSSFEGMNIKMALIDEISDTNYSNALSSWEQAEGSVFSRFKDGKVVAISWTRYPTANPLSDVGYYLYNKYKDNKDVYTIIASHKDVRGTLPRDYDENDIQKLKMYDCKFVIDEDTTLNINKIKFVKKQPILSLNLYNDDKYVRFKIKHLNKPNTKYCFCHIDTSINKDSSVISLFYNNTVEYHVIKPDKGLKISYEDLEELVKNLKKICKEISFDQFNSEFFIQKFNCKKYSFNQNEQYTVMKYFQTKMDEIEIIINEHKKRLEYEINHINIDNNAKKWKYMGKGSSDIIDAIIYSVYNSKIYETELNKNKSKLFGKNYNLFW